ncbi:MAG: tRNA preQ1(34) S-adenosylmethionine ribosyltransferase-isomerase QueA, partial [Thermodesulfobacterium geofontis]
MFIPKEFDIETYNYELPEDLIAYYPAKERTQSKLLVINRKRREFYFHERFSEIESYLKRGDLLILNNTKVFPARLKGRKTTGGEAELLLFQKPFGKRFETQALIKGKRIKKGTEIKINEVIKAKVLEKYEGGRFLIKLESAVENLESLIYKYGRAPLPPYIKREPEELDLERYQTVYAEREGSIAAPTAGLHFGKNLLARLEERGVIIKYIT